MKNCLIIAGPTAIGKTSIALSLAKFFKTGIISADSRQCFKELNIGVAKPSLRELQEVQHYFINSHSISQNISAADFEKYSLEAAGKIFMDHEIAIMVGGTGLYIKAFCEGFDPIPLIDEKIRESIIASYRDNGIKWLQDEIKIMDRRYFDSGEIQNPQRIMRALEVQLSTGRSILDYQSGKKTPRDFNIIKIGLELPREILYHQINQRVDEMISAGLVEEAKALMQFKDVNALQTVGYSELFDHFEGKTSLPKAIELIKQHTRHYAKRQMTWFKKDPSITWLPPELNLIYEHLKSLSL